MPEKPLDVPISTTCLAPVVSASIRKIRPSAIGTFIIPRRSFSFISPNTSRIFFSASSFGITTLVNLAGSRLAPGLGRRPAGWAIVTYAIDATTATAKNPIASARMSLLLLV